MKTAEELIALARVGDSAALRQLRARGYSARDINEAMRHEPPPGYPTSTEGETNVRELFEITADYPSPEPDLPENGRRETIRVMAEGHRQHIWTHTRLIGVSKAGSRRLNEFCQAHLQATIRVQVPRSPILDGWEED